MGDTHTCVPLPCVVNCSILFQELPLLRRPAAARGAGFEAVEFWWPFADAVPTGAEVDRFVAAIKDAGVRLVGLNLAAGDMQRGDRGLVSWPGRQAEFRDSLAVAVEIGSRLDVSVFNALYGNRVGGISGSGGANGGDALAQEQDELAIENLVEACREVDKIGATVLVEPLSGAPDYPLRAAADVVAVLDRVGQVSEVFNLAMLADFYHLAANGEDVGRVIAEYAGCVGHVQIADWPGRHEPGTGSLAIAEHLWGLVRAGYRGCVGLEYVPSTTTDRAFDWLSPEHRRAAGHFGGLQRS